MKVNLTRSMSEIEEEKKLNHNYQPTPSDTQDVMETKLSERHTAPPARSLSWKSFAIMFLLLTVGILAATGQHLFYSYVNGERVEDFTISQDWVIRVATAIAFLFQTVLVAAVGSAFTQRFWFAVRRESLAIGSIDAIFRILGDPRKFFNTEFMFKTKLLLLFAVISYLLPVATILSPGALTGNLFSIRVVVTIVVNDPSTTLSNSSVPVLSALDNDVGFVRTGSAWSYLGSSDQLRRVAARVLTNGEISPFPSPCGSNCTYNITFLGPAYKCIRLAPSATLPNLTNTTDEINTSLSPSSGLVTFDAAELSGNLTVQGLWVAYGSMPNMTIQCTLYNATYTTEVQFRNNIGVLSTSLKYHAQLDTSAIHDGTTNLSTDALHSLSETQPNSTQYAQQWKYSNMISMHRAIVEILEGSVERASALGGFIFHNTLIGRGLYHRRSRGIHFPIP
jgi:hypothetical protein